MCTTQRGMQFLLDSSLYSWTNFRCVSYADLHQNFVARAIAQNFVHRVLYHSSDYIGFARIIVTNTSNEAQPDACRMQRMRTQHDTLIGEYSKRGSIEQKRVQRYRRMNYAQTMVLFSWMHVCSLLGSLSRWEREAKSMNTFPCSCISHRDTSVSMSACIRCCFFQQDITSNVNYEICSASFEMCFC